MRPQVLWSMLSILWRAMFRKLDVLFLMFFLSVSLVFMTQVSLFEGAFYPAKLLSGVFWMTVVFVSLIVQHHIQIELSQNGFEQGLYHRGLEAIELFAAKLLFQFSTLILASFIVAGFLLLFVSPDLSQVGLGNLLLTGLLGLLAISALELLLFSIFSQMQSSLLLTSITLYPLLAPLVILLQVSSQKILQGLPDGQWLTLVGINCVLIALIGLLFDAVVEELL